MNFDVEKLKSKYPDASAVRVFNSITNTAQENGITELVTHTAVAILKDASVKDFSTLQFDYDPLTSDASVIEVKIHRKNGVIDAVPLDTVTDVPAPGGIIFWGGRLKTVTVPYLDAGDVLEYKFLRKGFRIAYLSGSEEDRFIPPMPGHFYDIIMFQDTIPVEKMTYTLVCPKNRPVQYAIYNTDANAACLLKDEKLIYTWEKENIPAFKDEKYMAAWPDVGPKLVYATLLDWREKSRWFHKVNEPQFKPDDAIIQKTNELLHGAQTEEEKIYRLVHWIGQNVRYLGLPMGKGEGYTTHPAVMTFHEKSGVCKDKAGLLVSMLRIAGFESYIVTTSAGARVEPVPADQFNHAVTCIRRPDKTFRYLDPTWVPNSRELWSSAEQEQGVIPGVEEGVPLELSPYSPPDENYFRINTTVKISGADAFVKFNSKTDNAPDTSLRRNLVALAPYNKHVFLEKLMNYICRGAEIKQMDFSDPEDFSSPSEVNFGIFCPDYVTLRNKNTACLKPPVSAFLCRESQMNSLFESVSTTDRSYDLRFRSTILFDFKETIVLPKGVKISSQPDNFDLSCPVAYAKMSCKSSKNRVVLSGKVALVKRQFPKEMYKEYKKVIDAVKKFCESYVIYGM